MPITAGTHVLYTVRPGDTLSSIAYAFGTNVQALVEANALYPPISDPNRILPGQSLLIRLPGMSQQSSVLYQVKPGDSLFRIGNDFSLSIDMLAAMNHIQQPGMIVVGQQLYIPGFVYEVETGDTLYTIARRYGTSLGQLFRWNQRRPGLSPDAIYPGYRLVVPLPHSANIVVFEPLPASLVAPGQRLSGIARAFEAVILYRIVDDAGRVVTSEKPITTTAGAPAYGAFEVALQFDQTPVHPTGTIMVYTRSANDNSVQDLVEIPYSHAF